MRVVYSDVPPIKRIPGAKSLIELFNENIEKADEVIIASGYGSQGGIEKLGELVEASSLKHIVVVLGMYGIEGIPENIYNISRRINSIWMKDNIGEIRLVKSLKYHGKVYVFIKDDKPFAAIIGSHNMSALAIDANNRRQYELSCFTDDGIECDEIYEHVRGLIDEPISFNIQDMTDINIIREKNHKLDNVEFVNKVSELEVQKTKDSLVNIKFELPLKVPGMPNTSQEFMGSNINKCYAKGRENKRTGAIKERGWWETEVIVGTGITNDINYPEKDTPFIAITDDGWQLTMHASGDHKKNFESHYDLKILGYWLKGRLVAAGIVSPVDSPSKDLEKIVDKPGQYDLCKGVITYQKLLDYGKTTLTLQKTSIQKEDREGNLRDVWLLSFLPN